MALIWHFIKSEDPKALNTTVSHPPIRSTPLGPLTISRQGVLPKDTTTDGQSGGTNQQPTGYRMDSYHRRHCRDEAIMLKISSLLLVGFLFGFCVEFFRFLYALTLSLIVKLNIFDNHTSASVNTQVCCLQSG
ncbi:hypothetical protein ILYODFUR_008600 [Ilyodon furcidens]|uniref:Uncharacterized protein n=1 Tax=Ilyodon furcidens TaxID=33524 RepID=A0ABV0T6E0_9TELE